MTGDVCVRDIQAHVGRIQRAMARSAPPKTAAAGTVRPNAESPGVVPVEVGAEPPPVVLPAPLVMDGVTDAEPEPDGAPVSLSLGPTQPVVMGWRMTPT